MITLRQSLAHRTVTLLARRPLTERVVDMVRAAMGNDRKMTAKSHDIIRRQAEAKYQTAIDDFIAHAKVEAMARKKKKREEMKALFLLLMLDAAEASYAAIYPKLAMLAGAPVTIPVKTEAADFAESRQEFLTKFPDAVVDSMDSVVQQAAHDATPMAEVRKELAERAEELRKKQGRTVAETEAQSCYGSAQIRVLRRAGYKKKRWQSMEDDRVRDSHERCQLQGAIPMDAKFVNGLRYPGETGAPPEETVNCRCWIEGTR